MRIVSWNIEWMNNWFVGGLQVALRAQTNGIPDVPKLATRVAKAITDSAADVVTVQEGPSDRLEMQLFVDEFLGGNYLVLGGLDGGSQKVYALVLDGGEYSDAKVAVDDLTQGLEEDWEVDVDGDEVLQGYGFTRRPLVVTGTRPDGKELRIVSLHTKSKYVHRGEAMWNDPMRRPQFVHAALINRRRISSEALRTRHYLNDLYEENADHLVVVTGDFNDGPGLDYFERGYLTHNVVDLLLGSSFSPDRFYEHAFLSRVDADDRYTARFDDYVDDIPDRPLFLDHVLLSPGLRDTASDGGIMHDIYEQGTPNPNGARHERISDHRPVFVDL